MSLFSKTRIRQIKGSCPTNTSTMFYFPEAEVNGEWKCLHGRNQGKHMLGVGVSNGLEGWKDRSMAEKCINMYKSQQYI